MIYKKNPNLDKTIMKLNCCFHCASLLCVVDGSRIILIFIKYLVQFFFLGKTNYNIFLLKISFHTL